MWVLLLENYIFPTQANNGMASWIVLCVVIFWGAMVDRWFSNNNDQEAQGEEAGERSTTLAAVGERRS